MTSLSLDDNTSQFQIRGYQSGQIQVNEMMLTESIIISPQHLIKNWGPKNFSEITSENLQPAIALKPDILIIGTGDQQEFLPLEVYGEFLNQGIGIELMTTPAACRTFNVLSSENRNVVAALII